ncbi:MAG: cytochrome c biogenesis protein ResB [Solobacterium sp.]|nr:cytochrome c biogenesis protein ResB [Solobacterium sp.]
MKKLTSFLKSMTFGVILLGLVIAVSVIGSVIPQQREAMYYVRQYPSTYQLILQLGLDRVFTSWYFIVIIILLCLNLILCSLLRWRFLQKADPAGAVLGRASDVKLPLAKRQAVETYLEKILRCRKVDAGKKKIYLKYQFGRYGTFITHLGILLTVIFFAAGMALPKLHDTSCYPGESIILDDGTEIMIESFSIEDDTGRLDYRSVINVTMPDGRSTGPSDLSVNHPVSIGSLKVYQQTYGTVGQISVTDNAGHKDSFFVESNDFLSADGKNGILIDNLYPGLEETEEGTKLIMSTSGRYKNPVYLFMVMQEGTQEAMLAFPGDEIEVGGYTYRFEAPVEYPGLRIKKAPAYANICLLISVMILTAGLFITFLLSPVTVLIDEEGYLLPGGRPEGVRLKLKAIADGKGETHA